jgi:cellobiose phosphorylase
MYRLIVESLLGLQRHGTTLSVAPRIPRHWETCSIDYRYNDHRYHIAIVQTGSGNLTPAVSVYLDGVEQDGGIVALIDDKRDHRINVYIRYEAASAGPADL